MIVSPEIAQNILEQALIYSFVISGVYLTSRVIKFDDLSVEGSFGLGAALITLGTSYGWSPWLLLPLVISAGMSVGLMTGFLHTRLGINNLMSGIIVTTALYSINLKIGGALLMCTMPTIFQQATALAIPAAKLSLLVLLAALFIAALVWFLNTEHGYLLQAVGCNEQMLTNLGKNITQYKLLGLALANGLTAFGGALFAQYLGYFSMGTSVGTLIIALAGLFLGEVLVYQWYLAVVVGSIAYQSIFATTIELGIAPVWNKLIIALIIVAVIVTQKQLNNQTERD